MLLKILLAILIAVLIIWFCSLCFSKIQEILDEKNYKKCITDYTGKLQAIIDLKGKLDEFENKFLELSKRLTKFETDFKTYDGLLENRLTNIEQVIQDWKDTMTGVLPCEHGCAECKSDDSKKSHPKTKPKEQLAEQGMKV